MDDIVDTLSALYESLENNIAFQESAENVQI